MVVRMGVVGVPPSRREGDGARSAEQADGEATNSKSSGSNGGEDSGRAVVRKVASSVAGRHEGGGVADSVDVGEAGAEESSVRGVLLGPGGRQLAAEGAGCVDENSAVFEIKGRVGGNKTIITSSEMANFRESPKMVVTRAQRRAGSDGRREAAMSDDDASEVAGGVVPAVGDDVPAVGDDVPAVGDGVQATEEAGAGGGAAASGGGDAAATSASGVAASEPGADVETRGGEGGDAGVAAMDADDAVAAETVAEEVVLVAVNREDARATGDGMGDV